MDLRVPAFVWYSDTYAAAFPQRLAALRANAMQPTLSADTFESLVDMAGIDMPGREPSWSLFNTKWHYRKRMINSIFQLDFDHSDTDETACDLVIPPKKP
jgi:glucan phosphoethanolaminetransferase (alkaline phosphatase superfamily)